MIALKSRDPPHAMLFTKEFDPTLSCPSKQETILSRKYTHKVEKVWKNVNYLPLLFLHLEVTYPYILVCRDGKKWTRTPFIHVQFSSVHESGSYFLSLEMIVSDLGSDWVIVAHDKKVYNPGF